MGPASFSKRFAASFALGAACLAWAPLAAPCRADPPPIGYVGPVPHADNPATPPPIGYVGPMPHPVSTVLTGDELGLPQPAPSPDHTGETLITARQMHSDSATNIVTATGKVEIVRGDYVLHADKVIYNQRTGVMVADGNVALLMPTGEVQFAQHEEITGDMNQAFAENIGILFPDNSRMAARTAQRYEGRYTVADKAMYTACNVCAKNPDHPPIWQLKADSITHDNVEHEVYYHNSTIDLAGVPVIYTPYISAPDPTVKRQQGFLSPSPGLSPNIGPLLRVPYYVDIAPDKDMTITPTFSQTDKAQLATQYRQRFENGNLLLSGSFTRADLIDDNGVDQGQQWRGNLFGTFLYDIDDTWRAGSDVQLVSDKSYLHRYNISGADQTTTRAYVEGFRGRDYTAVNSYYFQDMRAGPNAAQPIVMPSVTFSALGDPGQTLGGRWSFDGNTLITSRDNTGQTVSQQGPNTRRLSLNGGWERQLISDTGLVTQLSGLMRTDSYWANNIPSVDGSGTIYDHTAFTRPFAQANAVFRYPMGRSGDGYQQLIEPIVAITGAPDARVITKQPIEDSLDVEFDETNLFSPNRFTGSDLIEGGSRATYGVRNAITTDYGGRLDVFAGESYDFTANSEFPALSGLNGHASDYVGRIDFAPTTWMEANYGFRLARNDFSPQRQDAYLAIGTSYFRPFVRYIEAYENDSATGLLDQVKQASIGFSSVFAKYWTLSGSHTQSFSPQPGPRSTGINLTYVDECFAIGVAASHDDTNRVDINSGTTLGFHIYLRNVGGMNTDSAGGIQFPAEFRQMD
ncbi:MAG: LPS assembly protein LptD [Alphaproteobacteria bacterium]|nr:LPS assembly protein LptD [Alphaproteobacteria bacterium]